jgi:hypothetical protein
MPSNGRPIGSAAGELFLGHPSASRSCFSVVFLAPSAPTECRAAQSS